MAFYFYTKKPFLFILNGLSAYYNNFKSTFIKKGGRYMTVNELLHIEEFMKIYRFLQEQTIRQRTKMTIVGIRATSNTSYAQLKTMILQTARSSNLYFELSFDTIGVLLYDSTAKEAQYYLKRLKEAEEQVTWNAVICELRQNVEQFSVLQEEITAQFKREEIPFSIVESHRFLQSALLKQKVSVIEANAVTRQMLTQAISHIDLPNVALEVRSFEDGELFLSSDWYQSEQAHIVIVNAKLPRKNGIQIVSDLREMPNQRKFKIFLISSLPAPEDQIAAYAIGVDVYVVRPFHLAVLIAQIKQQIMRGLR